LSFAVVSQTHPYFEMCQNTTPFLGTPLAVSSKGAPEQFGPDVTSPEREAPAGQPSKERFLTLELAMLKNQIDLDGEASYRTLVNPRYCDCRLPCIRIDL
jgi:hypothetical protein